MRHNIAGTKLNRDSDHRQSLIRTQVCQLINIGHLKTTISKAKVIAQATESVLQKAHDDSVHGLRQLISTLNNPKLAKKAQQLAQTLGGRSGGFVKIIRLGTRRGDNVMMAKLELIPVLVEEKKDSKIEVKEEKIKDKKKIKTVKKNDVKTKAK